MPKEYRELYEKLKLADQFPSYPEFLRYAVQKEFDYRIRLREAGIREE